MRFCSRLFCAALVCVLFQSLSLEIYADSNSSNVESSTLSGKVYDRNGAVIVNAKVTFFNHTNEKVEVSTNDEGVFTVNLSAGFYRIEVSSPGFNTYRVSCYQLPASSRLTLDVTLTVGGEAFCKDPDTKVQRSKKRKTIIIE